MSKVLALSEETYERLLALAQERECTPEELIHTLLVDTERSCTSILRCAVKHNGEM